MVWRKKITKLLARFAIAVLAAFIAVACVSYFYALPISKAAEQSSRFILTPIFSLIYSADRMQAEEISASYDVGILDSAEPVSASWRSLAENNSFFKIVGSGTDGGVPRSVPFIYESPGAQHLSRFRHKYGLDNLVSHAKTEYEAMLKLGAWLGSKWDHGTDALPGSRNVCDPSLVIEEGELGAKYWCEIAARTTVQAATSLGWYARAITASRDGYTWEHAVAELWSNQFAKWFVLDTDFNIVYEANGIPLSAFELSTEGEALQDSGKLTIRQFAPPKPSLNMVDLVPYYAYVHIDMRNDWCSRSLKRGSPAGGDRATWWTARPSLGPVLTSKKRVDDPEIFNWPINTVAIRGLEIRRLEGENFALEVMFSTYSPDFAKFEVRLDDYAWRQLTNNAAEFGLEPGRHSIYARAITSSGHIGPVSRVTFDIS